MNVSLIEKTNRSRRSLATGSTWLSAKSGVRRIVATRGQALTGYSGHHATKRRRQRRHLLGPAGYVREGLVGSRNPPGNRSGIVGARLARDDSARGPFGLLPVCTHAVPARLRHFEARRSAWMLHDERLQGARWIAWGCTDGQQAGHLATCQKNENGSPATVRSITNTFRHGTKCETEMIEKRDFVPPRYKPPGFVGSHRSATGHLFRGAIYREIL